MKTKNKKCRKIREWLHKAVNNHLDLNSGWIQYHIANCPKCQQRLASVNKVNLALTLIKSRPHDLDLLMRANTHAIKVLKHSLRYSPKAEKLRSILPEPKFLEKFAIYKNSIVNTAACIAILVLMKTGVFSSMKQLQEDGQNAVKQNYTKQIGQDLADEIFSA